MADAIIDAPVPRTPTPRRNEDIEKRTLMRTDTAGDVSQGLREATTVTIAGVVVFLAAWMLVSTFQAAGKVTADTAAFTRQKDIMLYGLSLLGTVMGYYFGRAPAELRAKQAEKAANENQANLSNTQEKLTTATTAALESKRETDRLKDDVRATLSPLLEVQRKVLGGSGGAAEEAVMQDRIQRLLERL
jgi:Na+-transporting methylmalonyl-CoA/oxaloacetate decarboxylase gamma subunit